jgi:hypothetical protein
LAAVLLLLFQLYALWQQSRPVFDPQGRLLRLPEFSFPLLNADGKNCSPAMLHKGPVVVVYFGPACEHCRKLAKELATQQAPLSSINWVFVTRAPVVEARAYVEELELNGHSSVYFCHDEHARFYHFFGEMYIPSVYVFDSDRKYLQSLHQNTTVEDILSVLNGQVVARHKQTR